MPGAVSSPHEGSVSTHAIPGQVDPVGIDGQGLEQMSEQKIKVGDLPTALSFLPLGTAVACGATIRVS